MQYFYSWLYFFKVNLIRFKNPDATKKSEVANNSALSVCMMYFFSGLNLFYVAS